MILLNRDRFLFRKINTEESCQTGFEEERRIQSFIVKDRFCFKKRFIIYQKGWALFLFKRNSSILTGGTLLKKKILNTVNLS